MTETGLPLRIAQRMFANEGDAVKDGVEIISVGLGHAVVSRPVRPEMLNGHGTVHGGCLFMLADTAFAYACNSHNVAAVAQHAAISFLAPAHAGDTLTAEAREIVRNGRSGSYSVEIRRQDGCTIAHFQGLSRTIGRAVIEEEEA